MHRVVSLIPSSTEIVDALAMREALVGRSHECDFPAGVEALPALTAPKFDPHGTSAEIDTRVKHLLRDALSVYRVDEDLLRELNPDVIITQAQCEVCAVSLPDVEEAVCNALGDDARVVALEPNTLADVAADFQRVADALGIPERGQALCEAFNSRLDAVRDRTAGLASRPTVAAIEWPDPQMAAGNWVPELVTIAGGRNLFGQAGEHSPWLAWEDVVAADPDVIIMMPCGYDLPTTQRESGVVARLPGYSDLKAVRTGRVYAVDGNQYFNRPGPRLAESAEILAEILHGLDYGHQGTGWQAFTQGTAAETP
ncbi:MAG: cobalamin-binding protein [Anaerolineae bacterium]